jgi:hypothetical protein
MIQLTDEEIRAGFALLGLDTEEARAKFDRFAPPSAPDAGQEFVRLDNATRLPEADHAELA